jgi:hypothetical protein
MEDASMTKTQRVRLIAVLIVFSAIWLPAPSYAQQPETGTWIGFESYRTTYYEGAQIIGETSGSNIWTSLTIEFTNSPPPYSFTLRATMSIGGFSIFSTGVGTSVSSGPQNAAGDITQDYYPIGIDTGDFGVSYQAILPNGFIDTTGGFAIADMNLGDYDFQTLITTNTFVTFQGEGLPEPSSLVLAASGTLIVSIFAWMRGFTGR